MIQLLTNLWPELMLCGTACVLLVLGALGGSTGRRVAAPLAVLALLVVLVGQVMTFGSPSSDVDLTNSVGGGVIAQFIKIISCGAGVLFVLLAWPTGNREGGNGALAVGTETAEYFALLLLSIAGLLLTAGANNLILLFLGLELASIPTYIMVSISRPLPIAQEAGVKYFFLGALSAALMLLGFSYLYGLTGTIYLTGNGLAMPGVLDYFNGVLATRGLNQLEMLSVVLLLAGFGFKMAAFPLHVYAADVYQGAATPLTAMLSYVPKAAGLAAILKVLLVVGGWGLQYSQSLATLVAVIAVITMSVGNVLALLQLNVKRVMAYSSVAHSGYMLAGLAAVMAASQMPPESLSAARGVQIAAIGGTLFYLATYAVMNTGVFAVLQQLPAKARYGEQATSSQLEERGAASAETFDDLAGQARNHPVLAVAMAVCCLSLVGIPFTGGFLGKLLIAKPLVNSGLWWLLVAMMLNAAVSAGYYLRIPGAMFFRPLSGGSGRSPLVSWPASVVMGLCVLGTLLLGVVLPVTEKAAGAATTAVTTDYPSLVTAVPVTFPPDVLRRMPRVRPAAGTSPRQPAGQLPGNATTQPSPGN